MKWTTVGQNELQGGTIFVQRRNDRLPMILGQTKG